MPASHHGSPRYMLEKRQDGMAYIWKFGKPDLFITFSANPKWREITDNLFPG